ncbi:penicillin-binding protein [Halalkalibacterium ligniniphilum]|uniref:penicillin-binding protein n=1 Tax=Halalkalibacterium ligniniphilum TaxID=1134413 RepID=UPI000348BE22|nr:penicillin-binding protein [Halalkalibacterium ligniniphilum]
MEIKRATTNKRAVWLLVIFLFLFSVLLGRIVFIQVTKELDGFSLQAMAEERWSKTQVIDGKRGTIYDRNGGALAQEITSYTAYAILDEDYPGHVTDPRGTAEALADKIFMPVERLEALLSSDRFQVELGAGAKNMSHEQMTAIKELDLEGIYFRQEPRRYYPKHTYASHVIGYTEKDMETSRMGLELRLDEWLRAEDGLISYQTDRRGTPLPDPSEQVTPAKNGKDVYLTLDSNIQTALEQVMSKVEDEYTPEKIIAIVADPKTGQILAMSNRPSFNPNEYENITNYLNYAVSERFEPGSTMKVFTLAAAIEEGRFNANEQFQSGQYVIPNDPRPIRDHNQGRGWGTISYLEGVQRSSNVAFSKIAIEQLGRDKVYEYLDKFGFYTTTGIDLPNEATSLINNTSLRDAAATAFGQGTAVTPIQQIQAATAIANDGKMMKPYVIDRIVNSETGEVVEAHEPEVAGEPISKETAKEVRDILETVVTSSAGTGRSFYLEGFDVAGKTGTAQIPKPTGGYIYGHGQNIFSFLGMAPKEDPRLVVYVAVDRPSLEAHESGSEPVAMIFNHIMKHSLQYLNITPSYEEITKTIEEGFTVSDYEGEVVDDVQAELEEAGMDVYILGNGETVEAQQPLPGTGLLPGEKVMLRTTDNQFAMPNIVGWSMRDVHKLSTVLELNANLFGHGFVSTQSVSEGTPIQIGEHLVVELLTPSEALEAEEMAETDGNEETEESAENDAQLSNE